MVILYDKLGNKVVVNKKESKEMLTTGEYFTYFSLERLKKERDRLKREDKKQARKKEKKENKEQE